MMIADNVNSMMQIDFQTVMSCKGCYQNFHTNNTFHNGRRQYRLTKNLLHRVSSTKKNHINHVLKFDFNIAAKLKCHHTKQFHTASQHNMVSSYNVQCVTFCSFIFGSIHLYWTT